jgi:hypothetical protein
MKRVVTGVNEAGRSYAVSVDELDASEAQPVWEYAPADVRDWIAAIEPGVAAEWIEPDASGGVRWFFAPIPPASETPMPEMPGMDEDGWHTTRTIDFDILLDGEITLILDEDRIELQKGDFVIQQATRHAWKNESDRPAVLLALLHRPEGVA